LFRGDAAFAKPEVYEYLEQEKIGYAIRLSAKAVLQGEVAHLLLRSTEWPSRRPIVSYHDFTYQAQSWSVSRLIACMRKLLVILNSMIKDHRTWSPASQNS